MDNVFEVLLIFLIEILYVYKVNLYYIIFDIGVFVFCSVMFIEVY